MQTASPGASDQIYSLARIDVERSRVRVVTAAQENERLTGMDGPVDGLDAHSLRVLDVAWCTGSGASCCSD